MSKLAFGKCSPSAGSSCDALTQALHPVVADGEYGNHRFLGAQREEACGVLVRLRCWDRLPDFLFGQNCGQAPGLPGLHQFTDAGFLCAAGAVLELYCIAHLIEQLLGLSLHASLQQSELAYGDRS